MFDLIFAIIETIGLLSLIIIVGSVGIASFLIELDRALDAPDKDIASIVEKNNKINHICGWKLEED